MKKIIGLLALVLPGISFGDSPQCFEHSSGVNYCQYEGKVQQLYVNYQNLILMYFEVPVNRDYANGFGMNIADGTAGAIKIDDSPEFAKLFYSTALAAQASGRDVVIQTRGNLSGYLKIDRIWLK